MLATKTLKHLLGDILKTGKTSRCQKIWLETYQAINIEESPDKTELKVN